jgi:alkylation response protein AidB-like acyl-CoA dehydrogenase
MDFNFTEEQIAIQDSLRRFLTKDYGFEQRRTIAKSADGFSREAWATYAELGLLALPFSEEHGGLGGNSVDAMIVMETLGTNLALEPYLATVVVAGSLIADVGSDAQRDKLLGGITGGELLVSLAHQEPGARYNRQHVATSAKKEGDGHVLNGHKAVVLGAPSADQLLVSARTSGAAFDANGITLFVVDPKAAGVTVTGYTNQDGQRAGEVVLKNVKVGADAVLGKVDGALAGIERAIDRGIAGLCAEAVGIMTALNATTLDYLKQRKQFGVPIGKFQALQHRMAEMAIAAEQSRSMATLAALRADSTDAAERSRAVSGAKAYIGQALRKVGQDAVQMHGGMGVTDELMAAHYFKRLTIINSTFGDTDHHLARFSDTLLAA